jgi:hypothetical protein
MDKDKKLPVYQNPVDKKEVEIARPMGSNTNVLDIALENLTNEELSALRAKALGEKLRLEVDAQERELDYQHGKRAVDDHVDAFNTLEKGGRLTSQKVISDVKTGAGKMRIESKSGATCFVATAAYEDHNHEDVIFLRGFRDNILSMSRVGRLFTSLYWHVGPTLAVPVMRYPRLRYVVKSLIGTLVKVIKKLRR